ncbi:hypothetical protein TanjilG_16868 [Lupinus angustifolius]|nr:hypothetical protein TanjilG_16868 [Lupinus angustifolius]
MWCSPEPNSKPEDKPARSIPAAQNHTSVVALAEQIISPERLAASAGALIGKEGEKLSEGAFCFFAAQRGGGGKVACYFFNYSVGFCCCWEPGLDGFPL